ncbi:MAG: hypothetical protein QOE36_402 [Gaiellaceae bacterium]|nr:hypothetical protein [Gaiellaceae bacterium]
MGYPIALDEVHRLDGSLVVVVRGVVDDSTVERFEKGLDKAIGAGPSRVVVDLTRCRLFSAGFAALVRLERRGDGTASTRLVVRDTDLRRMLWVLRLSSTLPTFRTVADALQSFTGPVGISGPGRVGRLRGAPATSVSGLASRTRTARDYLLPHPAPSSEVRARRVRS